MTAADILAVTSGGLVGLFLGLLGGGGSILAVPLLLYVVGVADPHVALGTGAVAVAASAFANLLLHWRKGTVKWSCAFTFAASGILGAFAGAMLGQDVNGKKLLLAFAAAMIAVGVTMLRRPADAGDPAVKLNRPVAGRLVLSGMVTGFASGFFGIGGGFLIVPSLMTAANMTLVNAVACSLVAVTAFAASTALSYAVAGLVEWRLAGLFVIGGALGGVLAQVVAHQLAGRTRLLKQVFAIAIFATAIYVAVRSLS